MAWKPSNAHSAVGRLEAPPQAPGLLDIDDLEGSGGRGELTRRLRAALESIYRRLAARFDEGASVDELLGARAWGVEQLVLQAWRSCLENAEQLALVAVGGFGRGVLHPHSDVDLMILFDGDQLPEPQREGVEKFVGLLWDVGLYLGHSVRNLEQCVEEAREDVATATSLMEARLLAGPEDLFDAMTANNAPDRIWPADAFFHAKYDEQVARHQQFHDTAYNLEPNIKEGPGGLRDIQMIGWVARRHFGTPTLHGLVDHDFLTEGEYTELYEGQMYLWRVRFALHLLAGRAEDRLLFDYQRRIALQLGYTDDDGPNAAVERFMQGYYRRVTALERLNERLLQLFEEEFVDDSEPEGESLGEHFLLLHGYLDVRDPDLFARHPQALMKIFPLLARHTHIRGVRASAIRQIVDHLHLIDDQFRKDPEVLAAFLELLDQEQGIYTQLQRMNRYGVLAAFLPPFAKIVGRMQFDLFHVYTVDQHILFVVRNLRRFAYGKYREDFQHAPEVFGSIPRPRVLYLAALFHDIAKGRSGDHSDLGAVDAREFCSRLPMDSADAELVAWLVQYHLLMSQTAQKKDISDPEIIEEFAQVVGSLNRLNHLYLLTVADISATSPSLWNSWKAGLLWELYQATAGVLKLDAEEVPDQDEHMEQARGEALDALAQAGLDPASTSAFLDTLPDSVYLRFSAGQLAWAVGQRLDPDADDVVVAVRDREDRGVTEVFVSAPDYTGLFATVTSVLDEFGINVLSARVVTSSDSYSFDLFQVMDRHDSPLNSVDRAAVMEKLAALLTAREVAEPVHRRLPRRLRPFVSPPDIRFGSARGGTVTSMEIGCTDRPGLLSQLSAALVECRVRIHDAMIATLGDRVEDTFLVSDREDRPLKEALRTRLEAAIRKRLDTA